MCRLQSNQGMLDGLWQNRHAVVWVEHRSPLQQDASDPAQGTAVGMAARPQGVVAAAALGVVLDSHPGPMKCGLAQAGLGGMTHNDDARLAAALGDGRHARKSSECRAVPAHERSGRLGGQDGKGAAADTGQRREDGGIAGFTARCWFCLGQGGAEFIGLALGLVELAVRQAQPGDEGAQLQDGGFGHARSDLYGGRPQEAESGFRIDPADAVLLEQPRQRRPT